MWESRHLSPFGGCATLGVAWITDARWDLGTGGGVERTLKERGGKEITNEN